MRGMATLGLWGSGCLLLLGIASSCTIIGIGFGTPMVFVGLLGVLAFAVMRSVAKS